MMFFIKQFEIHFTIKLLTQQIGLNNTKRSYHLAFPTYQSHGYCPIYLILSGLKSLFSSNRINNG